jgi:phospholipid/cholesterol/gamma-HCH transport system substrate-binding protein
MKKSKFDLAVGLFVAAGLLALVFLAMKVGNLTGLESSEGYRLEARFDNIGGLKVRAPVKSSGVAVGRVDSITLDSQTYEAKAILRIDQNYKFSKDTIASILTSGLLGEQYVSLEAGGDSVYLGQGDRIAKTQPAMIMEKLISQFLFNKASETTGTSK